MSNSQCLESNYNHINKFQSNRSLYLEFSESNRIIVPIFNVIENYFSVNICAAPRFVGHFVNRVIRLCLS